MRGRPLYGMEGIDTAYIRQALGDFPLIGMFGGYELAPLGQANHLFAYTEVPAAHHRMIYESTGPIVFSRLHLNKVLT